MSWVRVTSSHGYQLVAPSFAPPPPLLGLERLTATPTNSIRLLFARPACYDAGAKESRDSTALALEPHVAATAAGAGVTVLVEQYDAGAALGHVTIAVAAQETDVHGLWESTHTVSASSSSDVAIDLVIPSLLLRQVARVKAALVCSDKAGVQRLLDSLCTGVVLDQRRAEAAQPSSAAVAKTGNASYRAELGMTGCLPSSLSHPDVHGPAVPPASPHQRAEDWLRRRAFLYFVNANVIPLSPLCAAVRYRSGTAPSPVDAISIPSTAGVAPVSKPKKATRRASVQAATAPTAADVVPTGFSCIPALAVGWLPEEHAPSTTTTASPPLTTATSKKTAAQLMKHQAPFWLAMADQATTALTELLRTVDSTIQHVADTVSCTADAHWTAWQAAWVPERVCAVAPFALPFAVCCSPSGILAASVTFHRDLSLEDRLRLTTLAVDQLVSPLAAVHSEAVTRGEGPVRLAQLPFCARARDESRTARSPNPAAAAEASAAGPPRRPECASGVGLYDVVLVTTGRAVAVLLGFPKSDAMTAAPMATALTSWMRAQSVHGGGGGGGDGAEQGVPEHDDARTAQHSLARLVDAAGALCEGAASGWSVEVEHALHTFEAAIEAGDVPTTPNSESAARTTTPSPTTRLCEPTETEGGAGSALLTDAHAKTARARSADSKKAAASPTMAASARQATAKQAKKSFACLATMCRKGKKASHPPQIPSAADSTRRASELSSRAVSAVPARAASSDVALSRASTTTTTTTTMIAAAAHLETSRVSGRSTIPDRQTLAWAWLFSAARVVSVEWHLAQTVEQDLPLTGNPSRPRTWACGVHAAFWLAYPLLSPASDGTVRADIASTPPPGYAIGFFRRTLQSTDTPVEDPTRVLTTVMAPLLDRPGGPVAIAAAGHAMCLVRPRASLVCSTTGADRHHREDRASRRGDGTTDGATHSEGLTDPRWSDTEVSDSDTDSVNMCEGDSCGGDADDDDDDDDDDACTDPSLLTCLSVPYTHSIGTGVTDAARAAPMYGIQSVVNLYGRHLGVESDLMDALARQKPVTKLVKEYFVSAEEADGAVRSAMLLHTLQCVAHSVLDHVHHASTS